MVMSWRRGVWAKSVWLMISRKKRKMESIIDRSLRVYDSYYEVDVNSSPSACSLEQTFKDRSIGAKLRWCRSHFFAMTGRCSLRWVTKLACASDLSKPIIHVLFVTCDCLPTDEQQSTR